VAVEARVSVTSGLRLGAFLLDGVFSIPIALIFTRPPSAAYTLAVTGIFVIQRIVLTATTGHSLGLPRISWSAPRSPSIAPARSFPDHVRATEAQRNHRERTGYFF
jgi:hypothetical protein